MTEADAASRSGPGKTARNEGRKLIATALNNLAVALTLAAFVQPIAIYLQQRKPLDLATALASLTFFVISATLFVGSQRTIRRLED
jgi:hypothetical protein